MEYWLGCHKYTKMCGLNVQPAQILCDAGSLQLLSEHLCIRFYDASYPCLKDCAMIQQLLQCNLSMFYGGRDAYKRSDVLFDSTPAETP